MTTSVAATNATSSHRHKQVHHSNDSTVVGQGPCPSCTSSDAFTSYSDGHGYCFSCQHYAHAAGKGGVHQERYRVLDDQLIQGDHKALTDRKISAETCEKFGYSIGNYNGRPCHIANYHDMAGKLVMQKLRFANKEFMVLGDIKAAGLFGAQLYGKGKMIVVTEGEIDALTIAEMQGHGKWPVVSVPNGAAGAKKALAKSVDYLSNFETVVLMFDNDEPGRKASAECAEMLGPSRCKIAVLPLKDPSDMMKAGRMSELLDAMWNARPYQPEGVIFGTDLLDLVMAPSVDSTSYPWPGLHAMTHGIRAGEITLLTAGISVGKSAVVREISYHLGNTLKQNVGLINLEENTQRSAIGLMGIHASKLLHLPEERLKVTDDQMKTWFHETLGTGRYFLIEQFGASDPGNLISRIKYLVSGCECKWIIIDPLSAIVAGQQEGDERRIIDNMMNELRALVQQLNFGLILVHHLKRPATGKGHENGAEVQMSQIRSSNMIGGFSNTVIGLERDLQGDQPHMTTVRVVKNRLSGETGIACYLAYQRDTGRLVETTPQHAENDSTPPIDFGSEEAQSKNFAGISEATTEETF